MLSAAKPNRARIGQLRYLVTGCAGFIGSSLTERLLSDGHVVVGYDNFATGQEAFLDKALASPNFRLVRGDVLDTAALTESMNGSEFVFHLAANADVRFGTQHPRKDLEQNTIATQNVLDAMRNNGIAKIAFSSSGFRVRRIPNHPDAGRRSISRSDLVLWSVQGGRRGIDCRLLRGIRIPVVYFPVRLDRGRTIHAWACLRFL